MRRKPIIAFSQRVDKVLSYNETRDSIDQQLVAWLLNLRCIPVAIPNIKTSDLEEWLYVIKPDGFIFSGGNDIEDYPIRDNLEFRLINYSIKENLPILGICRGMQILAYHENTFLQSVSGHINTRHQLTGKEVSKGLLPKEVNSFHKFAIKSCPFNYEVIAKSNDGEIEAIRHVKYNWEGWMWHPEREKSFSKIDYNRAKFVLKIRS